MQASERYQTDLNELLNLKMSTTHDVAIIGGGIVGASLALALRAAELDVVLIEPQPLQAVAAADAWDSRIYAISPGNATFLDSLGVWARLDVQRVQRVEAMAIFGDEPAGKLDFSAYDAGLRELAFIVEGGALLRVLREAMSGVSGLLTLSPAQAASLLVAEDRAQITLTDNATITARLVVGTDGGDSWVRREAGIAARISDYRQLGVVANFAIEQPHYGKAFQWFRHDGVLALLPLPGNRVSMVWSAALEQAQALLALDAQALADVVSEASQHALGRLQVITPAAGFPLRLTHVARLVAPRVALAGDAAHNVHPLAGQGVNLGMRDVRELAAVLAGRAPRQDCGDWPLLRRYERARREDITAIELSTDALQKLFAARSVWISGARNFGLGMIDRLPLLKNLLIRHAVA